MLMARPCAASGALARRGRKLQANVFTSSQLAAEIHADSCPHANNGDCDEPTYRNPGTDTTDCGGSSMSHIVLGGGHA